MDKLIQKLVRNAKKNKLLAFPALFCVFVLIFIRNIKRTVVDIGHMNKTKKMIAAVMVLLLLVGIIGPIGSLFRSMRVNAGTNPYVADWTDSQANYYWYSSAGAQAGLEYTIDSVQDLYELASLVNGSASVPGLGLVCDNFYGKKVYFNFTQLDMQCREFPVIGQDPVHPFLGDFIYRPYDESYLDSIDSLLIDHYYSEDSTKQLFGYTTMASADIPVVGSVDVNTAALSQLLSDQGSGYDYKYEGDVLYLPLDTDVSMIREYPVFSVSGQDDKKPWRSELAYTVADDTPVDLTGVVATAGTDGTLGIRLGVERSYSLKAFPGWDPANADKPVKSLTVSVVPRNTVTTPQGDRINIENVVNYFVALKDCGIQALDMTKASASVVNGDSITISEGNLDNQTLTIAGYGETTIHISSGIFGSDDKDVTVLVTPPVDAIEWSVTGGVATSGDADYVVYMDASIECTYELKNESDAVTSHIPDSLVSVTGIGEDMSRTGNVVTFTPRSEHYASGNVITITAGYGALTKSVVICVATSGDAVPPQAAATGSSRMAERMNAQAVGLGGDVANAPQVMADMGSVILPEGEVLASPGTVYQGNVFGITGGSLQINRYHKVTINANNSNGGYAASVVDKDGEADYYAIDENVIFLKNDCNFDLNITLDPTYEIRGNVIISPVSMQNTTITLTGQLLEKTGESPSDGGGKVCTYTLNSQGEERYQDCTILIQDVQSTNTNISAVVVNETSYPLRYIGNGTGTDIYTADIRYADFPAQAGEVTADKFVVAQSVQEMNILSAEMNEDGTACQITGYIRPQDGLTETVNYSVTLNRLPNDEALMKQLYIGDEPVADFAQPNSAVWVQEPENENGVVICKVVYNGARNLSEVSESDVSFGLSDNATWSGVLQEGVSSPHLFLNKYEDSSQLMFDVMVTSQDEKVFTKYRVVLQAGEKANNPAMIQIPGKVPYDPLQYQYVITDIIQNAGYCMEQAELIALAGGDGDGYLEAQQDVLRDRSQKLVEQDLLIYDGLQVNVVADVEYANQYVPAKAGTLIGAPGMNGEDGVYYFKVYITSNNGTGDITWEPISGKVKINATKYVPVEIDELDAQNGSIRLTLKDVPTECDVNKFEVEYTVDVLNSNDEVMVSGQRNAWGQLQAAGYSEDGMHYVISTPLMGQREQKQRVTVYVRYHYDDTTNEPYVSGMYEIAANDQCMTPQSVIMDRDGNVLDKVGQYDKTVYVQLTSMNAGVANDVYYSIGADGTGTYQKYVEPIEVSSGTTIYAYAENRDEYMSRSDMFSESYVVQIPVGITSAGLINKAEGLTVAASGLDAVLLMQNGYLGKDTAAIRVWLEITDLANNATDFILSGDARISKQAKALTDYCKDNNYYDYCTYNMVLVRSVTDAKGYEIAEKSGEITSMLPGGIRVTLTLPSQIQGRTDLQVLRVHTNEDGSISIHALPDLDDNSATYTYATDMMSLYAVVARMEDHMNPPEETTAAPKEIPTEAPTQTPTDGDEGGGGAAGSDDDDDDGDSSSSGSGSGTGGIVMPTQAPTEAPTRIPAQTSVTGDKTGVASGSNHADSINGSNSRTPTSAVAGNNTNKVTAGNTQTGDKAPIMLLVIVLVVSFILMIVVFIWGFKKRK